MLHGGAVASRGRATLSQLSVIDEQRIAAHGRREDGNGSFIPIFLRCKGDKRISRYGSKQDPQYHLEAIDVENDEFKAWDRDGLPVRLALQKPVWIKLEASQNSPAPGQLREALLQYAASVGIQLPDELPVDGFSEVLSRINAEYEKQRLAKSAFRRFLSRF